LEIGLPILHIFEVVFNVLDYVQLCERGPRRIFLGLLPEAREELLCLNVDGGHVLCVLVRHVFEDLSLAAHALEAMRRCDKARNLLVVGLAKLLK